MNLFSISRVLPIFLVFSPCQASAQTVTVTQDMAFGQVTLVDNAAARAIAFQNNGSYTSDPQYYFLSNPVIAHVEVENYPPNTQLTVTFDPEPASLNPQTGAGDFTVDDFFTIPAVVTTDGNGDVTFDVGATLRSDGASAYSDTTFSVGVDVVVEAPP